MASTFQSRRIRVTFKLATGSFNKEGEPDTVSYEGLRIKCEIHAPGGWEFAQTRAEIYGLSSEVMNRLTVINYQNLDLMRNSILIEATDENGKYGSIFQGEIYIAQPDYAGAPDVPFIVEARAGLIGSLQTSQAYSFPGAQKVSAIMGVLAKEMNLTLEDAGVTTTVTDEYLAGSPLAKIQKLASDARIQFWYLPEQGVLAIAPANTPRTIETLQVGPTTGLVGWPVKTTVGIEFTRLFSPTMFHGCPIHMTTSIPACVGDWYIISMTHRLESEVPGGAWFTFAVAAGTQLAIRQ
ncbi:MAG: baseplate hub protein [Plesiomonas shigelloides]